MNLEVFDFNWLFRKSDGLLYGYTLKPAVIRSAHALSPMFAEEPKVKCVKNDKAVLIEEKDNELGFINKNKLYHISDLIKETPK